MIEVKLEQKYKKKIKIKILGVNCNRVIQKLFLVLCYPQTWLASYNFIKLHALSFKWSQSNFYLVGQRFSTK